MPGKSLRETLNPVVRVVRLLGLEYAFCVLSFCGKYRRRFPTGRNVVCVKKWASGTCCADGDYRAVVKVIDKNGSFVAVVGGDVGLLVGFFDAVPALSTV